MLDRYEQWQEMHQSKAKAIEEFKDRKFGLFIHFGLYSMLGGEWDGKRMEECLRPHVAEWIFHAFRIERDRYWALKESFNPVEFSAAFIAGIAKKAGMRYVVITAKHHDGFGLYDSANNDFNSMNTPYGKDIISALYEACEAEGLEFGLYYSHSIDWMHGGDGGVRDYKNSDDVETRLHGYNDWDPADITYDAYIHEKALPQVEEILTIFKGLSNIWFDVPYYMPEKYSYAFYKKCYDLQPQALISYRVGNGFGDIDCPGDNVVPDADQIGVKPWEGIGTMNNSWGYKSYDDDWKTTAETLCWLVDMISKGGNYMLNIGPDGQGKVPEENVSILTEIGQWIKINGEAIYETRPWEISHEGPFKLEVKGTGDRIKRKISLEISEKDWWFTKKEAFVYAISLAPGMGKEKVIEAFGKLEIEELQLVGSDEALDFTQEMNLLKFNLPESMTTSNGFAVRALIKNHC